MLHSHTERMSRMSETIQTAEISVKKEVEAFGWIDMSNDFVHEKGTLTAGKPAQEIVPYLIEKANETLERGGVVFIAMDSHQPYDPHFDEWPPHNVVGTWGQELYGGLKEWYEAHKDHPMVVYVPKTQYDAFYETDLEEQLRRRGVKKIHLGGVCTDICDFLTAAGAYYRGFKTVVHRLGTATFTPNHDTFLEHMKLCFHTEIV
jgi:nicotinamidase-related amidase